MVAVAGPRTRDHRRSTVIERLSLIPGEYVLATIHRAENTDDPELLESICRSLAEVSETFPVVLPLHPRTRKALSQANLLDFATERLRICEPLGYLDMTKLESSARVIATDSGGVQKEAFFHGVPCVTLRTETEWVELVEMGWNTVCDPRTGDIANLVLEARAPDATEAAPYGDGTASRTIARKIASHASGDR